MDKSVKKLITEVINEFFENALEKLIERGVREVYYDVCPHCKKEIHEKHDYTEDGGVTWRHSDCKGLISRPQTPLEEVGEWLRPYVKEAQDQRTAAREAMGLPPLPKVDGLPPSGEDKYEKQEPGGTFGTSNSATIGNV